jgi:uncharacterized protein (DUF58 family)
VRQYVPEREITAWFLLDLTPSMDFGTVDAQRLKRTVLWISWPPWRGC